MIYDFLQNQLKYYLLCQYYLKTMFLKSLGYEFRFPVILSIEDNCSVPVQRLLAREIREILGDYLLTTPVSREETCLPSPAALKRKIILKHKKLPTESDDITLQQIDDGEFF